MIKKKVVKKKKSKKLSVENLAKQERRRIRKEERRIKRLLQQEADAALKETDQKELADLFEESARIYRKSLIRTAIQTFGIVNGAQQANAILAKKLNMDKASIPVELIIRFSDYIFQVKAFRKMLRQSKLPQFARDMLLERFVTRLVPTDGKAPPTRNKLDLLLEEIHNSTKVNENLLRESVKRKPK